MKGLRISSRFQISGERSYDLANGVQDDDDDDDDDVHDKPRCEVCPGKAMILTQG